VFCEWRLVQLWCLAGTLARMLLFVQQNIFNEFFSVLSNEAKKKNVSLVWAIRFQQNYYVIKSISHIQTKKKQRTNFLEEGVIIMYEYIWCTAFYFCKNIEIST